jgi:hypothetical protein
MVNIVKNKLKFMHFFMKKITFLFLTGALFNFGSISALPVIIESQPITILSEPEYLTIHVPFSGEKNHALIKQALGAYPGVVYLGKCVEQNFYFISVDRSLQPGDAFIEETFRTLSLDHYIKTGTLAQKVMADCSTMIETLNTSPVTIER